VNLGIRDSAQAAPKMAKIRLAGGYEVQFKESDWIYGHFTKILDAPMTIMENRNHVKLRLFLDAEFNPLGKKEKFTDLTLSQTCKELKKIYFETYGKWAKVQKIKIKKRDFCIVEFWSEDQMTRQYLFMKKSSSRPKDLYFTYTLTFVFPREAESKKYDQEIEGFMVGLK